jgi:hypothetical protein
MYAIASLLDPASDQVVQNLWQRFEQNCGLVGIKSAPHPHFSWLSADLYQVELAEAALEELADQFKDFRVRAAGLGIFTGPQPVVYITLVKDMVLMNAHHKLWERLHRFAILPNHHYDPDSWMPHITLVMHDMDPQRLACAVADVAFQRFDFEIVVNHFAVLYQMNGNAGLKSRFLFQQDRYSIGGNK